MLTSQQTKSKYRKAANNFINTNHDNTNESNKYISLHNNKKTYINTNFKMVQAIIMTPVIKSQRVQPSSHHVTVSDWGNGKSGR